MTTSKESGALQAVEPWVVELEAENYGRAERQQLYRSRIEGLPRDLQRLARDSERQVLEKLATPLEIQRFFDAMRTQDRHERHDSPILATAFGLTPDTNAQHREHPETQHIAS